MMPDFTDIWTAEGWLYVAVVLDLFSRCAVGWSMKADRDASLVMDALMMTGRRFLAFLVAEVRCQLRAQHPFHELDLQLFHQPCFAEQILRALNALQQFIQKFLGDRHACFLSMKHGPDHSYTEDLTLSLYGSSLVTAIVQAFASRALPGRTSKAAQPPMAISIMPSTVHRSGTSPKKTNPHRIAKIM